jgi:hypothetical protein
MLNERFDQIAIFIRDERTGRLVFNGRALKALGIDPAEVRAWGYPLKNFDDLQPDAAA